MTLRGLGQDVRYVSLDDLPASLPLRAALVAYPHFAAARFRREARRGLDVIDSSPGDAWVWGSLARSPARPLLVTRSHGLAHLHHERKLEWAAREGGRLRPRYRLYHGRWLLYEVARSLRVADLVLVLNEGERAYVTDDSESLQIAFGLRQTGSRLVP